jgi:hypothetical protein
MGAAGLGRSIEGAAAVDDELILRVLAFGPAGKVMDDGFGPLCLPRRWRRQVEESAAVLELRPVALDAAAEGGPKEAAAAIGGKAGHGVGAAGKAEEAGEDRFRPLGLSRPVRRQLEGCAAALAPAGGRAAQFRRAEERTAGLGNEASDGSGTVRASGEAVEGGFGPLRLAGGWRR